MMWKFQVQYYDVLCHEKIGEMTNTFLNLSTFEVFEIWDLGLSNFNTRIPYTPPQKLAVWKDAHHLAPNVQKLKMRQFSKIEVVNLKSWVITRIVY